jgi:hypothetical protein
MVYLDNYLLTLNSKYASTYINGSAKSNVQFNFIGLLREDADIIRTSLSILNCQIPVSYYIITGNNNKFTYADYAAGVPLTITIPVGNYDANTLIIYMNTQFTTYPIVMSINSSNGKIQMVTLAAFAGLRVYANSTSAEIFGIGSTDISVVGGAGGSTLVFPYPLNLLGVKKISIKSSSLSIIAFSSVNNNYSDTICTIPADQPAFGMISYTSQNDLNKNLLKQSVIDRVDIQLLDENQNYLDFNNLDWSITICLSNERIDRKMDMITLNDITRGAIYSPEATNEKKPLELINPKPVELTKDEKELSFLQE